MLDAAGRPRRRGRHADRHREGLPPRPGRPARPRRPAGPRGRRRAPHRRAPSAGWSAACSAAATADAGPVTVLCCDNLTDNGTVVDGLVGDFCRALPTRRGRRAGRVDRRQRRLPQLDGRPHRPGDDRRRPRGRARALSGLDDEGLVIAEPFRPVGDRGPTSPADRPAWELAGAQLTDDVAPYELMKLRHAQRLALHAGLPRRAARLPHHRRRRRRRRRCAEIADRADPRRHDPHPGAAGRASTSSAYGDQRADPVRQPGPAAHHRPDRDGRLAEAAAAARRARPAAAIEAGRRPHAITLGAGRVDGVRRARPGPRRPPPPAERPDGRRPRTRSAGRPTPRRVVDRLLAIGPIFGPELPELGWWRRELVDDVRDLLAGHLPALTART